MIIFYISKKNIKEQSQESYNSYVDLANIEIFDIFYPLLEKNHVPGIDSFEAVANSTAEKYKVKILDVYNYESLAKVSIKKIMSNNSLTPKRRKDLSDDIMKEIKKLKKKGISRKELIPLKEKTKDYDSKRMNLISLIFAFIGMVTGIITVINSFFQERQTVTTELDLTLLYVILIIVITLLFSIISPWILRKIRTKKQIENNKDILKKKVKKVKNKGGE